jgi:hypothetical protein
MDFGRAFSYVMEDSEWLKKVGLGGLFMLLVVTIPAVFGYFLEVIQRVAWRQETPLPEWSDFGDKWVKGLLFCIIAFIYSLPGTIIMFIGFVPVFMAGLAGSERGAGLAVGGMFIFMALAFLWFLIVAIIFPAVSIQYALYRNFGAAFQFGQIVKIITANVGAYIMAIIAYLAANFLASLPSIIPFVGTIISIFAYFYAYLVGAHAFGQIAQGLVQQQAPASSEAPSES